MGRLKLVIVSLIVAMPVLTFSAGVWPARQLVLEPDPAGLLPVDLAGVEKSARIVAERLKTLNQPGRVAVQGQTIVVSGLAGNQPADLPAILTRSGKIELIDAGTEFPRLGDGHKIRTDVAANPDQGVYRVLLNNGDFSEARLLAPPSRGKFGLEITLTPAGAARLAGYLAHQYGIYLCLAEDDILLGCPIVTIDGHRLIVRQGPTDFLVSDSALVDQINLGVLPVPLVVVKP